MLMLPSQVLLLLCHLENDLVIIIYVAYKSIDSFDTLLQLHKPN